MLNILNFQRTDEKEKKAKRFAVRKSRIHSEMVRQNRRRHEISPESRKNVKKEICGTARRTTRN